MPFVANLEKSWAKKSNIFTTISKIKMRQNTLNPKQTCLHSSFTCFSSINFNYVTHFWNLATHWPKHRRDAYWSLASYWTIRALGCEHLYTVTYCSSQMTLFLYSPLVRQSATRRILYFPFHTTQVINLTLPHVRQSTDCYLFNYHFVNWGTRT
jgi:hypothetical protein